MKKRMPYSTPEGYFENLKERLSRIPERHAKARPAFGGISPLLAVAASLVIGVVLGISLVSPRQTGASEDNDIIEYLIYSGTTLAQIEYTFDQIQSES